MNASASAMLAPAAAPSAPASAPSSVKPRNSGGGDDSAPSFDRMLDRGAATPSGPAEAAADAADANAGGSGERNEPAADPAGLPDQLLSLLGALPPPAAAPAPAVPVMPEAVAPDAVLTGQTAAQRPGPAVLPGMQPALPAATPAATPAAAAPVFAALVDTQGKRNAEPALAIDALATTDVPAPTAPLSAAPVLRTDAPSPLAAPLAQPLDPQAGFDDGFGSRIVWMAEQRLGHADIRITPEHLGTIDVRLQLDGTKVSAEFFSSQAEVRQALESSFNRLRDLLGQQGLQLAHADVGQQRSGKGDANATGGGARDDAEPAAAPAPAAIVRSRRLLDEYA